MASIAKRRMANGKTRWQVRWRTGGRGSKAKAKSFDNVNDARIFAAQVDRNGGDPTAAQALADTPLQEYCHRWLSEQEQLTKATGGGTVALAPSSLNVYRAMLQHVMGPLGHLPMSAVTRGDVTAALLQMSTNMSYNSTKLCRAALHKVFEDAVARGALQVNPTPTGRQLKLPKSKLAYDGPAAYTRAQVAAMVAATDDIQTKVLIKLLASTGLRRGEALGLQWRHVQLGNDPALDYQPTIHIEQTVVQQGAKAVVQPYGKTSTSLRSFPLSAQESAMLQALRDHQVANDNRMNPRHRRWSPDVFLFHGSSGGRDKVLRPMPPNTATRKVRDLRKAIGADRSISPMHGLRHAAIHTMLMGGVPAPAVAKRVGHATPHLTLSVYGQANDDDLLDLAQQLSDIWAQEPADPFA